MRRREILEGRLAMIRTKSLGWSLLLICFLFNIRVRCLRMEEWVNA